MRSQEWRLLTKRITKISDNQKLQPQVCQSPSSRRYHQHSSQGPTKDWNRRRRISGTDYFEKTTVFVTSAAENEWLKLRAKVWFCCPLKFGKAKKIFTWFLGNGLLVETTKEFSCNIFNKALLLSPKMFVVSARFWLFQ